MYLYFVKVIWIDTVLITQDFPDSTPKRNFNRYGIFGGGLLVK